MDLGLAGWGEALRVFGHSEKNCRYESAITKVAKSANPCHIRPVVRGAGIKKGELRSVHLFQLVADGSHPKNRLSRLGSTTAGR